MESPPLKIITTWLHVLSSNFEGASNFKAGLAIMGCETRWPPETLDNIKYEQKPPKRAEIQAGEVVPGEH